MSARGLTESGDVPGSVVLRLRRGQADGSGRSAEDRVAAEEPLEIQVEGRPVSVTMRTPGHDDELAAGFLLSEGLIRGRGDIRAIRPYPRNRHGNSIGVFLAEGIRCDFASLTRHVFASSSCGLCGAASIAAIRKKFPPHDGTVRMSARVLAGLPDAMRAGQAAFAGTGGLHAAALFDADGGLRVLREDVGRHNAVDKAIGRALLDGLTPLRGQLLLASGRVSFEITQKALAAGIGFVAAVSAPTSLAVQFARRSRMTLVGFLRDGRYNVYAGAARIVAGKAGR
jgi:FdhD protein